MLFLGGLGLLSNGLLKGEVSRLAMMLSGSPAYGKPVGIAGSDQRVGSSGYPENGSPLSILGGLYMGLENELGGALRKVMSMLKSSCVRCALCIFGAAFHDDQVSARRTLQ